MQTEAVATGTKEEETGKDAGETNPEEPERVPGEEEKPARQAKLPLVEGVRGIARDKGPVLPVLRCFDIPADAEEDGWFCTGNGEGEICGYWNQDQDERCGQCNYPWLEELEVMVEYQER